MEEIESIVTKLNATEINAIKEAHSFTFSQVNVLSLVMSYISDLRNNRVDISDIKTRAINLEGFLIQGEFVFTLIESIKSNNEESIRILYAISKNFFRGTAYPVFEISNNARVKKLLSLICFDDFNHFEGFFNTISVIRHFLSHNYSDRVIFSNWDIQDDSTVKKLKDSGIGVINFSYNGYKYFPEIYQKNKFVIDIKFDLSRVEIGKSMFDAISVKELFFLGELCNNLLFKTIKEINRITSI